VQLLALDFLLALAEVHELGLGFMNFGLHVFHLGGGRLGHELICVFEDKQVMIFIREGDGAGSGRGLFGHTEASILLIELKYRTF
jgi:hypothetical protein